MKYQNKTREDRGFSLVEMLVVIAVIGIIAAIAVPSIGAINDKANVAKAKRNGQTIASLYNASRGVGASYGTTEMSEIIDKLVEGMSGPELSGTEFRMSSLSEDERTAAMAYVSYDSSSDLMIYDPSGTQVAAAAVDAWWGDWHPSDGGWTPTPLEWIPTKEQADAWAGEVGAAYPDYTFASHQPVYGSAWKVYGMANAVD